ncbi:MAG: EAL domain-containing protein, partial [Pseudomonadota bacterium]
MDARHAEAARLDRASRGRQRELNDRLTRLASATLSAARVQREIDAVARYNATDAGRSISLERVVVVAEGVPAPCGPDAPGGAERLCAPSSARVHDALAQLEASAPEDLEQRIQTAQWALVGYVRAGERRFRALSAELSAALDAAASARGRLDRAAETLGSLSRLLRIVRQADETLTRATRADRDGLDFKDRLLRAVLTQIDLRASGTAAAIGEAAGPARDAAQTIETVRADWAEAFAALKDRRRAEAALDGALAEVDATLSRIDAATNAATAYWVGLVSTAALTAIGALCAVAVALAWGARGMIAAPLAQTTATLLALSRDEPIRPVRLTSRALGFGALEQALERLRLANIERAALTRTTLEQRAAIERNLDALARTTREMERQARHDALTGLPNRRFADEVLGGLRPPVAEAAGVAEAAPQDFTILHIDVDRFKEINDTLGHDAGDAVLRHIADLLTALIGPNDRAFRIGGDEFLILRQAEASKAGASKLAADIIAAMNAPVDFQGHACRIGASIGVAHGGDAGFDGRTALVNADIALYEAKNAGRNRCAYFSKALQERTVSRKTLTDQLRVAIEREAFEPVYQPQFFARGLALRGVETLCRWRHPEHGLLAPGAFLAQAEEANLVGAIDEILLRKAGRDLAAFRAAGLSIPKISFNVTADRLTHAGLAETLLREVGAETMIAVELLESMSLDTLSETVRWAIDELKDRGIAIEIDDFGSCRASVAGLMAVGPDTMKIDGAIVGPITTSEQHLRLVKAIIDIGAALGIEVVAERVDLHGVRSDGHQSG